MSAPRMPGNLRPAEKKAWKALVDELGGPDALRQSDAALLRSMAILVARLEDIRAFLAQLELAPPAPSGRWSRPGAESTRPAGLGYLVAPTARGVTGHPLLGHERETIKELRLLHERLERLVASRSVDPARPKSLREMRAQLHVTKTG